MHQLSAVTVALTNASISEPVDFSIAGDASQPVALFLNGMGFHYVPATFRSSFGMYTVFFSERLFKRVYAFLNSYRFFASPIQMATLIFQS